MNYVDSHTLEQVWGNWNKYKRKKDYEELCIMIYKICDGVSKKFYPKDKEEHEELTNQAFYMVLDKINRGVLKYTPGKASVFNLLTTATYNLLYSYKTKQRNEVNRIKKYAFKRYNIKIGE